MRQSGERVHGPYRHRNRWRVILAGRGGSQEVVSFPTEAEARQYKAHLLKQIEGRTVSDAVQAYLVSLRDRGLRSSTVVRDEYHLRGFFQLDDFTDDKRVPFARTGGYLDDLRPKKCEELYTALRTGERKIETHRNALVGAKAFGAWCVEQKWIRSNPLADIKPVGPRKRGQQQLRIDEARELVEQCLKLADQMHAGAIATLTALMLGLRASEVTDRVVRDLDDDGHLLWVPFGKTQRSRRTLEVPELLRPYLLELAKGRRPEERLFDAGDTFYSRERTEKAATSVPRDRHWLWRQVQTICEKAGVQRVSAHSLRGLHSTLATEAGATAHFVASALGHSSTQVTEMHYIDRAATHRAKTRKVVDKLQARAQPAGATSAVGNG